MDYSEIDQLIDLLENELQDIEPLHTRWKPFWDSISVIGAGFKETRYPTRDEKDKAWQRFQSLVDHVKQEQNEDRKQRERLASTSEEFKDEILKLAYEATPLSGLEETIWDVTFGLVERGVKAVIDAVLPSPKIDEVKSMLVYCSEKLREGWNLLSEHKAEMLGQDKKEAFNALLHAQNALNDAWERWRKFKDEAWEAYHEQKREKREDWENRVQANIEKLEERLEKLNNVLRHKESHLDDLHDKLSSAWNDDYRDRVEGWIDEEENAIEDIKGKIDQIENWLEEDHDKLKT